LDFGCGYGRFCDLVSSFVDNVYGVDIASVCTGNVIDNKKIKFIDTDGKTINLNDKTVELITSFDCLEHIAEEDIDKILTEFKRVATKGFVVSVAPVGDSFFEVPLHLTIKPISWWIEKFSNYGKVSVIGATPITNLPYISCKF
jgi:SAM-dependent methyltransferase